MATNQARALLRQLQKAVPLPDGAGLTDGQLLVGFIERHDEVAFAALVRRHGPMVWGVCRRLLGHHDAEDAFQAAFLVLARKAASVVPRERLASWLHGVARQAALQAKRASDRRRAREKQVAAFHEPIVEEPDRWEDLRPVLDRELASLPEKYRILVVLCDLEGRTRKEVARQLGCPEGTVAGRLVRARALLAKRLIRHGLVVTGGALTALLSDRAAVPAAVVAAAGRTGAAGLISARVVALAGEVLRTMLLTKLSKTVFVLALLGVVTFAGGMVARGQADGLRSDVGDPLAQAAGQGRVEYGATNQPPAAPPTGRTEGTELQGRWKVLVVKYAGSVDRELAVEDLRVRITADRFVVRDERAGRYLVEADYQVGPEPPFIDFTFKAGAAVKGRFRLEGDLLTVAYPDRPGEKRPADFVPRADTHLFLLQREAEARSGRRARDTPKKGPAPRIEARLLTVTPAGGGTYKLRIRVDRYYRELDDRGVPRTGFIVREGEDSVQVTIDGRPAKLADLPSDVPVTIQLAADGPNVTRIEANVRQELERVRQRLRELEGRK
jgi:RNA polymerase sigma factor (sigma-70 family)